jgi:hypothetical protein
MGKTGESKTGESPTGDKPTLRIIVPTQSWSWEPQTADVTGDGVAEISAPANDLAVESQTADVTGEGEVTVDVPAQSWAWESQTADVTGEGVAEISAPTQTLEWDGPTPSVGFVRWVINGQSIRVTDVTLTPTTLTLGVRARDAAERSLLDTLDGDAGAYEERARADGTNEAVDTAAGSNTFTVYPRVAMQPPRIAREWLVDDVSRTRTSADTQATTATVTLVATETRTALTGYADAADSDKWTFDFSAGGQIVTNRVTNIDQGETTALTLVLTDVQAELAETVAAATAGAVVREVPDGQWFSEDTTPNSRQTVDITPPSGAADPAISADTYVVETWESVGDDGQAFRWRVEIDTRY